MYCICFFFIFQTIVFSSQSYCQQQLCSSILNLQENLKGAQVKSSVSSSFFWYDIREILSYLFQAYVTGFSISNFFIPLVVLICTNASICITIWKNMGQFTQINLNLQNQVRKMTILLTYNIYLCRYIISQKLRNTYVLYYCSMIIFRITLNSNNFNQIQKKCKFSTQKKK